MSDSDTVQAWQLRYAASHQLHITLCCMAWMVGKRLDGALLCMLRCNPFVCTAAKCTAALVVVHHWHTGETTAAGRQLVTGLMLPVQPSSGTGTGCCQVTGI